MLPEYNQRYTTSKVAEAEYLPAVGTVAPTCITLAV